MNFKNRNYVHSAGLVPRTLAPELIASSDSRFHKKANLGREILQGSSFTNDGTQYAKTGLTTDGFTGVTLCGWVKNLNGSGAMLGSFGSGDRCYFGINSSKAAAGIGGRSWGDIKSIEDVNTGDWVHICVTSDGSLTELFVGGLLAYSNAQLGSFSNTESLYLGAFQNATNVGSPMTGSLADLRVYDRAFTNTEIIEVMKGERVPNGLRGAWFTGAKDFLDASGNGNHAIPYEGAEVSTDSTAPVCSLNKVGESANYKIVDSSSSGWGTCGARGKVKIPAGEDFVFECEFSERFVNGRYMRMGISDVSRDFNYTGVDFNIRAEGSSDSMFANLNSAIAGSEFSSNGDHPKRIKIERVSGVTKGYYDGVEICTFNASPNVEMEPKFLATSSSGKGFKNAYLNGVAVEWEDLTNVEVTPTKLSATLIDPNKDALDGVTTHPTSALPFKVQSTGGNCLVFDGTKHIAFQIEDTDTSDIDVELFVNKSSTTSDCPLSFTGGDGSGGAVNYFSIRLQSGGSVVVDCGDGNTSSNKGFAIGLQTGEWVKLRVKRYFTTLQLWVNDELFDTVTTLPLYATAKTLFVGARGFHDSISDLKFTGSISKVLSNSKEIPLSEGAGNVVTSYDGANTTIASVNGGADWRTESPVKRNNELGFSKRFGQNLNGLKPRNALPMAPSFKVKVTFIDRSEDAQFQYLLDCGDSAPKLYLNNGVANSTLGVVSEDQVVGLIRSVEATYSSPLAEFPEILFRSTHVSQTFRGIVLSYKITDLDDNVLFDLYDDALTHEVGDKDTFIRIPSSDGVKDFLGFPATNPPVKDGTNGDETEFEIVAEDGNLPVEVGNQYPSTSSWNPMRDPIPEGWSVRRHGRHAENLCHQSGDLTQWTANGSSAVIDEEGFFAVSNLDQAGSRSINSTLSGMFDGSHIIRCKVKAGSGNKIELGIYRIGGGFLDVEDWEVLNLSGDETLSISGDRLVVSGMTMGRELEVLLQIQGSTTHEKLYFYPNGVNPNTTGDTIFIKEPQIYKGTLEDPIPDYIETTDTAIVIDERTGYDRISLVRPSTYALVGSYEENLVKNSNDLSQWASNGVTATSQADGWELNKTASFANAALNTAGSGFISEAGSYVLQVYVKAGTTTHLNAAIRNGGGTLWAATQSEVVQGDADVTQDVFPRIYNLDSEWSLVRMEFFIDVIDSNSGRVYFYPDLSGGVLPNKSLFVKDIQIYKGTLDDPIPDYVETTTSPVAIDERVEKPVKLLLDNYTKNKD